MSTKIPIVKVMIFEKIYFSIWVLKEKDKRAAMFFIVMLMVDIRHSLSWKSGNKSFVNSPDSS